jgi:hypothetical protein
MSALIAIRFLCVQPEGGQFPSDAAHVNKRQTWLDQGKAIEKKLMRDICECACIAIANGLPGTLNPSFAVVIANTFQAVVGSC